MASDNDRRVWLRLLCKTTMSELEAAWKCTNASIAFQTLRSAEVGLAMIQGRADGTGRPFNLGEATVTRCVVRCTDSGNNRPLLGIGYTLGRDKKRTRLIAQFDALFQDSADGKSLQESILPALAERRNSEESVAAQKSAATRVEFFTMVRGE